MKTKQKQDRVFTKEFLYNSGIAAGIALLSSVLVVEEWTWKIIGAMVAAAGLVFLNKCRDKLNKSKKGSLRLFSFY